ncbi:MAG TPA: ethanolamine ammonia-lyase subunit EutC [Candidatus Sulfotelmatobacter sp.]|jgi:ethanolamine ammonia-lyase small subunit|nr:ethanolamine ammonia-lyase subunit EutC [Candidatus Sulfotelmatobacter sp.]
MSDNKPIPLRNDPWSRFRAATQARINLGRSGDALPTPALLQFQADHARARDAVHGAVDFAALADAVAPHPSIAVQSRAGDRSTYLRRPDLGRRLSESSAAALPRTGPWDILFVVADGLSAQAVTAHAATTLKACMARLPGWRIAPVVLAAQSRIALGDEAGGIMKADMVAVLVGERPGLSVADSLGIYLTWNPKIGCKDSARNCISNIHAAGLSPDQAAAKLAWLAGEAKNRQLTGVDLKEDADTPLLPGG